MTWPPSNDAPNSGPPGLPRPASAPEWPREERRLRILIVDDEADIRASLKEALEGQLDATVLAVEDAKEARRLLATGRCDVVLLDHLMPGISGAELLTWMSRQHLATRTIVITALPNELLSSSPLMLRGASAVLRKPLDLREVLGIIQGLLPRPEGQAPS